MGLLQRALLMAAKRAASDPHLQARARQVARDEIGPRVRDAAVRAKPAIEEAATRVRRSADEVRTAAAEHPPTEDPAAFLRAARDRLGPRR